MPESLEYVVDDREFEEKRLLADAEEHNATVVGPCLYGGWATK
ncbi:hypothetical protein AB0H34_17590 [Saccharopolyspora shandongensis]